MIALADCNNFYASCERVFSPRLKNKPVVVLSNNDGCIIARSNESKALGIKMGEPVFKIREVIEKNNVHIFSTNFALYGDMSSRVMSILSSMSPGTEIYSIDEAFMDFKGVHNAEPLAAHMRETVSKSTGIPISIGIAPTKTLAKVANHIAKKHSKRGVCLLQNRSQILDALAALSVSKLWGVGRKSAEKLHVYGVKSAHDFMRLDERWVQKNMSITGVRMQRELRGETCFSIDTQPDRKKSICTSRSFSSKLSDIDSIRESVVSHASRCAEKLRYQESCAGNISVVLQTDPYSKSQRYYGGYKSISLNIPSNDTIELVKASVDLLESIYIDNLVYKKAGVIVGDIVPDDSVQLHLFSKDTARDRVDLCSSVDFINKTMGRDKVQILGQGVSVRQKLKQENLSPCYTTRWSDLLRVGC